MWCYRHGFCKNPWRSWEKHRTRVLGRALGDASSTFVDPFLRWGVDEGGVQKDGDTENDPAIDDPHMRSSLKRETCSFICRYTLSMMCFFMQHNIQCIYIIIYVYIHFYIRCDLSSMWMSSNSFSWPSCHQLPSDCAGVLSAARGATLQWGAVPGAIWNLSWLKAMKNYAGEVEKNSNAKKSHGLFLK